MKTDVSSLKQQQQKSSVQVELFSLLITSSLRKSKMPQRQNYKLLNKRQILLFPA